MIRDLHRKGLSISEIARKTGRDRKTVRKVISAGLPPAGGSPAQRRKQRAIKLAPYESYVKQRIEEGVLNTRKLLREIKERGYDGGLTQLILYVQPYRTVREERAVMRYETAPGQQAQVDWSTLGYIAVDGKQKRLYAFVMTLGYSRMMYVEFTTSTDTSLWLRCHQHAFEYFGGIPREMLHDNLKTAVLARGSGGKVYWNPRYLDFALYNGFSPYPCRPYRAQTKGKVERSIQYVQQSFWVGTHFQDLADLNRQALAWLATVANVRIHGTTGVSPVSRHPYENLQVLPTTRFDTYPIVPRRASRDCLVQYQGNSYSVPASQAQTTLLLKETEAGWLHIYSAEQILIAEHRLVSGHHQRVILESHYQGLPEPLPRRQEALAYQSVPLLLAALSPQVETRSLSIYADLLEMDS